MIVEIKRPKTVREAMKEKSSAEAAFLGGGTRLNARPAERPPVLISLENLGLDTITAAGDRCILGAAVTLQQIIDTAVVPPGLREAAALCASRTLRNMRSLGGELGAFPEDSALLPVLMALDARISLAGRKKTMTIDDFARDRPKDLILSVTIEAGDRRCRVRAVARTSHSPRSLVVAVSARVAAGRLGDVRVIVSDCAGERLRLAALEKALEAALPEKARIEELVGREFSPGPDLYASAGYKGYLAGVLVADAAHALAAEAARA
jgi:putative selenate reductase FAD-binding subunit